VSQGPGERESCAICYISKGRRVCVRPTNGSETLLYRLTIEANMVNSGICECMSPRHFDVLYAPTDVGRWRIRRLPLGLRSGRGAPITMDLQDIIFAFWGLRAVLVTHLQHIQSSVRSMHSSAYMLMHRCIHYPPSL
jgi:hypothetical protein